MPTSARFLFAEVIRDPVESERHPTALGLPFGKRCRSCSPRTRACKAGWGGDCRGRFPKSRISASVGFAFAFPGEHGARRCFWYAR